MGSHSNARDGRALGCPSYTVFYLGLTLYKIHG